MVAEQNNTSLRVEVIDGWHADWPEVRQWIESHGQDAALHLAEDGYPSARQSVLVGYREDRIAGVVSFSVAPIREGDRPSAEATLDAISFDEPNLPETSELLLGAAREHAFAVGAGTLRLPEDA